VHVARRSAPSVPWLASTITLGISSDGKTLVAANNYNDSISVIDTATGTVRYEYDLRPYATGAPTGTKGGTFPYSVVLNGTVAYVGCDRDREVVAVNVASSSAGALVARIPLDGKSKRHDAQRRWLKALCRAG
jgi:DNA-binding beta-propeller fold protein YncE